MDKSERKETKEKEIEMNRGVGLIFQQMRSLLVKNFLLSWRNKRATALQLVSSLFFIALLFGIDKATSSMNPQSTAYNSVKDPPALVAPPITPCEERFFVKKPCYDFLWSGIKTPRIKAIVDAIMNNNPGRIIPTSKVLWRRTEEEIDSWLLDHPLQAVGALHFTEINSTVISYGVQTNSSTSYIRGLFEDPTFKFQIPLIVAAEREIARSLIGDTNFSWTHGFKEFAHPAKTMFSALGSIGPAFFLAFTMFGFVLQITALVTEKELKLRQAMTMTGLYDSAYWMSWIIWDVILILISSVFLVLFGMMFQFEFFKSNNFAVLFLFFFLFQLSMTGFGYMLSSLFIKKALSATTVGFAVFIISFFTQLVTLFGFPYRIETVSSYWRTIWSIFPPNLLAQGVSILVDATATPEDKGISWNGRKRCYDDSSKCYITLNDMYVWFVATFAVWFTLAIYFDNIIPNASGMRKSLFYFLDINYWTGRGKNKAKDGSICSCMSSIPEEVHVIPDDEDVLEEENTVKEDVRNGTIKSNVAVQIQELVKTYPGVKKSCCSCKRTPPYHAVKGFSINFMENQLFCLLGPNGAGKTTVINCLTGITPVSNGNALIYGHSIRSAVGMSNIRKIIGVCPQFDILWDALTGEEHINLFASIKGMPSSAIKQVAEETLENVKLSDAAKVRTRSYSGGMRRRLSVAISLIGDPKLVILDEPTTGMDPISRRLVWDIIQNAKKGRAIILTTHSMEEADILNDRLGIMAKGRLRCIGTSIRLKSKFGAGFITNVSFSNGQDGRSPINGHVDHLTGHEAVKEFFKTNLGVVPAEENKSFMTFVIPREKEKVLMHFFGELQDRETEFGISDIQLGLATLEEVFLNIASQAEVENASEEGRVATLNHESGISVKVPIGARYIFIPGTETADNPRGFMVEVFWAQDDSGNLGISGSTNLIPLPNQVQLSESALPTAPSMFRRKKAPILGIVISSDQIRSHSSRRYNPL